MSRFDEEAPAPCKCAASWANSPCRCSWRRPRCEYIACRSYAIWTDVDTGSQFCGAHAVLAMDSEPDDALDKRREFADEYARDAAKEYGR